MTSPKSDPRPTPTTRYRLVSDDDGHDYIIPADKRAEWNAFMALDPDDEASWVPPAWAERLGLAPTCYTFTNWQEDR